MFETTTSNRRAGSASGEANSTTTRVRLRVVAARLQRLASTSVPNTGPAPSFAAAIASTPEPQP